MHLQQLELNSLYRLNLRIILHKLNSFDFRVHLFFMLPCSNEIFNTNFFCIYASKLNYIFYSYIHYFLWDDSSCLICEIFSFSLFFFSAKQGPRSIFLVSKEGRISFFLLLGGRLLRFT